METQKLAVMPDIVICPYEHGCLEINVLWSFVFQFRYQAYGSDALGLGTSAPFSRYKILSPCDVSLGHDIEESHEREMRP